MKIKHNLSLDWSKQLVTVQQTSSQIPQIQFFIADNFAAPSFIVDLTFFHQIVIYYETAW